MEPISLAAILWRLVVSFRSEQMSAQLFSSLPATPPIPPPPPLGPGEFRLVGGSIPPDLRCVDANPADFLHLALVPGLSLSIKAETMSPSPVFRGAGFDAADMV